MRTYRIDLSDFVLVAPNESGLLATSNAVVGNLPITGIELHRGEGGETYITCRAKQSAEALKALHAVVAWACADTSANGNA